MKKSKKDVSQTDGMMKSLMDIVDGFAVRFINHHMEALREFAEQGEGLAEAETE